MAKTLPPPPVAFWKAASSRIVHELVDDIGRRRDRDKDRRRGGVLHQRGFEVHARLQARSVAGEIDA